MSALYALDASGMRTAKDAVDTIGRYPHTLVHVEHDIAQIHLGPYTVYTVCGDRPPATVWGKTFSITEPTHLLKPILTEISASNVEFLSDFKTFLGWLSQALPAANEKFRNVTDKLETLSQTKNPTKGQRDNALTELSELVMSLRQGSEKLKPYVSASARKVEENNDHLKTVQNVITALNDRLDKAFNFLRNMYEKDGSPCGMAKFERSVGKVRDEHTATIGKLDAVLDMLRIRTTEVNSALALISGTLINFSASYNAVINPLERARNPELSSVIQEFQVTVSWKSWKAFADYVKDQLQPSLTNVYCSLVPDLIPG
ncbi:hypothetical protein [Saccharopolyspora elongata]|uniref:Uncharacterized protein n=1 Tax=Saccharopolyspora elongata TaxID=2530387 RepID=A0A4R4Z861_9PSEU|nr:hypothetical protein [Saccharopolyspora elongata]TDD53354.1 hypothetical protein E1288_09565 [Saccharopolyspora elongata]